MVAGKAPARVSKRRKSRPRQWTIVASINGHVSTIMMARLRVNGELHIALVWNDSTLAKGSPSVFANSGRSDPAASLRRLRGSVHLWSGRGASGSA